MADVFRRKMRFSVMFGFTVLVLLTAVIIGLLKVYEFEKPQITFLGDNSLLGAVADISIQANDARSGVQEVQVSISQGQKKFSVFEKKMTRQGVFSNAGPEKIAETFSLDVGRLGFDDGRADLVITVRDFSFWNWMQGNKASASYPVFLDTQVPKIWKVNSPDTIRPGSAGVVVYRVNEEVERHGVEIDGVFHPGFPVSGRSDDLKGAMIGIPYDTKSVGSAKIIAYDKAGNRGNINFGITIRKVLKKTDRINVGKGFLDKKMPEFAQYYPEMQNMGSQLEQYLYVNNEVRKLNNNRITEICSSSVPERLWSGRFKRMRRSSRRAGYADYRSYYYDGKVVDNQVHLGIDLASVRGAEVEAANSGKVVFSGYLGIYGQMVVVDHGIGVFSLYSHLSQLHVKEGDRVEKGAVIGNTGVSGMAGGDHLHFSMLVNGVFVNPLEWWDGSWLELNVLNYIEKAK